MPRRTSCSKTPSLRPAQLKHLDGLPSKERERATHTGIALGTCVSLTKHHQASIVQSLSNVSDICTRGLAKSSYLGADARIVRASRPAAFHPPPIVLALWLYTVLVLYRNCDKEQEVPAFTHNQTRMGGGWEVGGKRRAEERASSRPAPTSKNVSIIGALSIIWI